MHLSDSVLTAAVEQFIYTDRVVCREKEVAQVAKFVEDHVGKQVPGSLYILGCTRHRQDCSGLQ